MKNLILKLIALLAITLSSCTPVIFEKPMPNNGEEFTSYPKELQGMYLNTDPNQKDTIVIRDDKITGVDPEKIIDIESKFKKVIKKHKDYWVFNYSGKDSTSGQGWIPYIVKVKADEISFYYLRLDLDENQNEPKDANENERKKNINKNLNILKKITSVKAVKGKDNRNAYIVNPSNEEFDKLIESKLLYLDGKFVKIK